MDSHNRQLQIGSREDEDGKFVRYMNENGVIKLEEGGQELDIQEFIEGEEEQQLLGLDIGNTLEQNEDGILFQESPSDGDRSCGQSWNEQFSFSQMSEERRNQDFIGIHNKDDLGFMDQPSRSMTFPSALGRRPPTRDQQLDMTEDEVDQGSSLGGWDGDEEDNWSTQQLGLLFNENGRLEGYNQTLAGEDQWDNLSGSPDEDYSNIPGSQGGEAIKESISPSSPPLPSMWDTQSFGMLGLSSGIENETLETLPEYLHTDSGEGSTAILSGDHGKVSRNIPVSKQTGSLRTMSSTSPSSLTKMQNAQHSSEKKSKNPAIAQYGRGQLNYPLPDFSKVTPRVRFPRDEQGYRPPQPHRPENPNQSPPGLFKSPAEIVREVLLSNAEMSPQEPVISPTVPQEFKTPQQATELVHQLQEDYHKLLTKYAEAENTIDRLRLGAKVHLYSDPAKPSHSVQMGTVMQGLKVMEFTIPHAQTANFSSVNEDNAITNGDTGSSDPMDHLVTPSDPTVPGTSGYSFLQDPEDSTSTLRSHLETLHKEVDIFEGLLQGGNLTPEEQHQAVKELSDSLNVLERRYLRAQDKHRQEQRRTGSQSQGLDPQRELEEAIFQLGIQLDELQERVDHSTQANHNTDLTRTTHHLDKAPLPSAFVPVPATKTPYPQVTSPGPPGLPGTSVATSHKEDPAEYLPQPLRYKHSQLEKDYGNLLSTYSSFKSLPDALGLEQDEWPQQLPQIARPHDHQGSLTGQGQLQASQEDGAQATRTPRLVIPVSKQNEPDDKQAVSSQDHQLQTKTKRRSPRTNHQRHSRSNFPQSFPLTGSPSGDMHSSSTGSVPVSSSPSEQRRASSASRRHSMVPDEENSSFRRMSHWSKTFPQRVSLSSSLPQLKEQSPRTPTRELSASEDSLQGSPFHKRTMSNKNVNPSNHKGSPRKFKGNVSQRRTLSPETDSGFLGSESGQSFLLQKQRQWSLNREKPGAAHNFSNAALKNERRLSKNGGLNFPHKVLRDHGKQNQSWTGPSETTSPSLGPKSLTESDSHMDESDSERERSNTPNGDICSGGSLLPSPTDEPPLRIVMESRVAKDQAIHKLQKEVTQLRHLLENSLNWSPARGKSWKPAIVQNQHGGEDSHFPTDLDSAFYRHRTPVNDSGAEHKWRNSVSHEHDPTHQAAQRRKGVQGLYRGTQYQFSDPLEMPATEPVKMKHCQRCQESERKRHGLRHSVTMKTSKEEEESVPPTHPACLFCKGKTGSDNTPRNGMTNGENRRHRRQQPFQHWHTSHPPPVSYIPSPLVPYNPPIIYSAAPGIYVPVGYNAADARSSRNSNTLDLDDISYPLSQALEAAKDLKVTSKRMCQSLTTDLTMQRSLRSSCLF